MEGNAVLFAAACLGNVYFLEIGRYEENRLAHRCY